MPSTQTRLTAGFDEQMHQRRERVVALRDRARELRERWARVFGPHDTPVPVDRAWVGLNTALRNVQDEDAGRYIEQAVEQLDAAAWVMEDVEEGASRRGGEDRE